MTDFSVDAYTPKQIAERIESAGIVKSTGEPMRVFALAILAGAFIAIAAAFYTLVTYDNTGMASGLMRLIGGLAFSLGLILVVVAGAELFTGNNLIVMAFVDKKVTLTQLIQNWLIVYIGNLVGAVGLLLMVYLSGHWLIDGGAVGDKASAIAQAKVNLTWTEAFFRGVLCNILVCLAVWLCYAGRTVVDKVFAIVFPVTAFVAMGFEHSIANMYFIPAGMLAGSMDITMSDFLLNNLLPVTLGNVIGGSVFVGLCYWFIYLRK